MLRMRISIDAGDLTFELPINHQNIKDCYSSMPYQEVSEHNDLETLQRYLEVSLLAETLKLLLWLGFAKDSSKIAQRLRRN